jgi:hypothetical protein
MTADVRANIIKISTFTLCCALFIQFSLSRNDIFLFIYFSFYSLFLFIFIDMLAYLLTSSLDYSRSQRFMLSVSRCKGFIFTSMDALNNSFHFIINKFITAILRSTFTLRQQFSLASVEMSHTE